MSKPIVVGVDGSAQAWRAVEEAVAHARLHRLPVRLVHASGERTAGIDGVLEEAREYALKQEPELTVHACLLDGPADHALTAESADASLVVVGSRGRGGFESLLLGSVGAYTAAHARCPVMVVPTALRPAGSHAEVVVGVAGDRSEEPLLRWAFDEAERRRAELVLAHATNEEPGSARARTEGERILAEAVAGWAGRHPDVEIASRVVGGTAAQALVAMSERAGLVVVGVRRHPWYAPAPGHTVTSLLHHARRPVVLVPVMEGVASR